MLTAELVEKNFKTEFTALLNKYDADVFLTKGESKIYFYIPPSWDIDGELIREENLLQFPINSYE